jgi:hypothetical protein
MKIHENMTRRVFYCGSNTGISKFSWVRTQELGSTKHPCHACIHYKVNCFFGYHFS